MFGRNAMKSIANAAKQAAAKAPVAPANSRPNTIGQAVTNAVNSSTNLSKSVPGKIASAVSSAVNAPKASAPAGAFKPMSQLAPKMISAMGNVARSGRMKSGGKTSKSSSKKSNW